MAQKELHEIAESGTRQSKTAATGCPTWDNMGRELLPFFTPTEERKRNGFRVTFLTDGPRKEKVNEYDPKNPKPELWFDIEVQGQQMTWTISQISLITELKAHAPLKNKAFDIKLIPVTKEFKKDNPKYKGKDRYQIKEVNAGAAEAISIEDIEDVEEHYT